MAIQKSNRQKVSRIFSRALKGKLVIIGIGNILRGDDAFGPALIEKLKDKVNAVCIDAGSAPENYTGKVVKESPQAVILADAAHLGLEPGEYDILSKDEISKTGFTTHDLSPNMFMDYLENETKADIYMLAVQPERVSFGDEMSDKIKEAIDQITEMIKEANHA